MGNKKKSARTFKRLVEAFDGRPKAPIQERWISMSNALIRAGHGLSLSEKRIIALAASQIDSHKLPRRTSDGTDFVPPRIRIKATEYATAFGVDRDTAYDQLRAATEHLWQRQISFFDPAGKRGGAPLAVVRRMRWVGEVQYHHGEGWVELHLWPKLVPLLQGLRQQFTTYQLKSVSALRSAYSWRLLELLSRFRSTGWAEYAVEDFAAAMDTTEKMRADFAKLRTKVIEPAVLELTEKSGWQIQWRAIKQGRKVVAVRFDFIPGGAEPPRPEDRERLFLGGPENLEDEPPWLNDAPPPEE